MNWLTKPLFLIPAFAFLLLGSLAGCSSQSKQACKEVDWFEIGRRDGAAGRKELALKSHDICSEEDFKPLSYLYYHGRMAGLAEYCDPRNAFELGRAGVPHNHVCPLEYQDRFITHYNRGKRALALEKQNSKILNKLSTLELKILSPKKTGKKSLLEEIQNLKNQSQIINKSLTRLEEEVEQSTDEESFFR